MSSTQITPPTKPVTLTPEDFGPARYGVHLFDHEDDWGWTAFGHPDSGRLLAAINQLARECGVAKNLHDEIGGAAIDAAIQHRWVNNIRSEAPHFENILWDWCEDTAPGAVAVTVVTP